MKKLLIANRGEIACRIIRTARRLGITTVAIFSQYDQYTQHVLMADEAFLLDGSTLAETYLNREKIIAIAKSSAADAIHPGYGFLSEDPQFADDVPAAGLIFVGPSGDIIKQMGDKENAKAIAEAAQVPITKDYRESLTTDADIESGAKHVGYPLLVKATTGGGGKGMRLVHDAKDLLESAHLAMREAEAFFGNPTIFLEKYVRPARHIEVQVAFDQHGNGVHLSTRECSIQRRHQKIIEEAPANLPADVTEKICHAAVALGKHIGYVGLGTMEFLLDEQHEFYFMEMNTRLQVEHPITEFITGIDCVELQLSIADGKPISIPQSEITVTGHAIEARICAENPYNDFLPSTGQLNNMVFPDDETIRVDSGFTAGDQISPHYDSLIAKLIVFTDTREQAVAELHRALSETMITGLSTNCDFLTRLIALPDFKSEIIDTLFVDKHLDDIANDRKNIPPSTQAKCLGYTLLYQTLSQPSAIEDPYSPWNMPDHWRLNDSLPYPMSLLLNGKEYCYSLTNHFPIFKVIVDNEYFSITLDESHSCILINDQSADCVAFEEGNTLQLFSNGHQFSITLNLDTDDGNQTAVSSNQLTSPMPGTVTEVKCQVGDVVAENTTLIGVEAMKMEHTIKAPRNATVAAILVSTGESVSEGQLLIELQGEES